MKILSDQIYMKKILIEYKSLRNDSFVIFKEYNQIKNNKYNYLDRILFK